MADKQTQTPRGLLAIEFVDDVLFEYPPILADEGDEKNVYLLTNVPTRLPVDELTTFDEFLDPLGSAVDVRDSAIELLDAMVSSAKDDENDVPYVTDGGLF